MFVSDGRGREGGGGVIWSEGAEVFQGEDRTGPCFLSVTNVTGENSSSAFLFTLVEFS